MNKQGKLQQLELWLQRHNVSKCGDAVYDGMGVITMIDKGIFDYKIIIQPLCSNYNLGNGYGNMIIVSF